MMPFKELITALTLSALFSIFPFLLTLYKGDDKGAERNFQNLQLLVLLLMGFLISCCIHTF